MKIFLSIMLLSTIILLNCYSQEIQFQTYIAGDDSISLPLVNGKITYTDIIKIDSSKTKDLIYTALRTWLVKAFVSSKNVIQFEDKDNGIIMGKANIAVTSKKGWDYGVVNFSLTLHVKPGRFKYEITDFVHEFWTSNDQYPRLTNYGAGALERNNAEGIQGMSDDELVHIKEQLNSKMIQLISSLKQAVDKYSLDSDKW
jgi:hypothetical protein